jgi:hypothetical protein
MVGLRDAGRATPARGRATLTPVNLRRAIRSAALAFAWLAVAVFVALGAAGVVAAMSHAPGTPARPELTWAGDRAAAGALDAATTELERLSAEMDVLGETARRALTEMVAGDTVALAGTTASGSEQLERVSVQAARLEAALAAVGAAGADRELRLSADTLRRYDALAATSGLTAGLRAQWAAFGDRAVAGAALAALLARHDEETAAAAAKGSGAHYRKALTLLDASDATIAQTRELRDRLARTTDVTMLTTWIDRNAAYDAALRDLYQALLKSKGRVTSAVRTAFGAEQAARAQLPADTRGLVVIMSDLARGGLNQAVIGIEEARGAIASALEVQRAIESEEEPGG